MKTLQDLIRPALPLGLAALALAASPALALVRSGDSAAGMIETIPPVVGTLDVAPSSTTAPIPLAHAGAFDADSALLRVELWVRTDFTPWAPTGMESAGATGDFGFMPPGSAPDSHGTYYFALVAEDERGNRSAEPSGFGGAGLASTSFDTFASVAHWEVFQ